MCLCAFYSLLCYKIRIWIVTTHRNHYIRPLLKTQCAVPFERRTLEEEIIAAKRSGEPVQGIKSVVTAVEERRSHLRGGEEFAVGLVHCSVRRSQRC